MANEVVIINGVTKQRVNNTDNYNYDFPKASVIINTETDSLTINTLSNYGDTIAYAFADITDNFGTTNIEEYVDYLAANDFFFDIPEAGGAILTPLPVTVVEPLIVEVDNVVKIGFLESNSDKSGALHTESILTQIDLKHTKDKLPLFYDEILNGAATSTHDATKAGVVMTVTNSGDYAIRQTFDRFNYLTGKTKKIDNTIVDFGVEADVIKRFGYFNGGEVAPYDTKDGLYLEMDGATHNCVISNNGVDTKRDRSTWDDPLDGTGASGLNIDINNFLISRIKFLWLGGGPVTFLLETNDDLVPFCTFKNGAAITGIYMQSPNQPIRYEIRSTGGSGSVTQICSTVGSYGGENVLGVERGKLGFKGVKLSSKDTKYVAYAIRLKQTHLDVTVSILDFIASTVSKDDFNYYVLLDPTISGTLTFNDEPNSALQIAIGDGSQTVTTDNFTIRAGVGIQETPVAISQQNARKIGSSIDGVAQILVFCLESDSNNATAKAAFNWIENN